MALAWYIFSSWNSTDRQRMILFKKVEQILSIKIACRSSSDRFFKPSEVMRAFQFRFSERVVQKCSSLWRIEADFLGGTEGVFGMNIWKCNQILKIVIHTVWPSLAFKFRGDLGGGGGREAGECPGGARKVCPPQKKFNPPLFVLYSLYASVFIIIKKLYFLQEKSEEGVPRVPPWKL